MTKRIILDYDTNCDHCERNIPAGEVVCALCDCDESWEDLPIEELKEYWVLNFCEECGRINVVDNRIEDNQ